MGLGAKPGLADRQQLWSSATLINSAVFLILEDTNPRPLSMHPHVIVIRRLRNEPLRWRASTSVTAPVVRLQLGLAFPGVYEYLRVVMSLCKEVSRIL